MKSIQYKQQGRQGDVFMRRITQLPDGIKQDKVVDGKYILGHSESGHAHTMAADDVILYYIDDPLIAYLEVKSPTPLIHEKTYDVHESIMIDEGIYEIRRQREYTPKGFRRVVD